VRHDVVQFSGDAQPLLDQCPRGPVGLRLHPLLGLADQPLGVPALGTHGDADHPGGAEHDNGGDHPVA
jgi:hypothetical protein